MRLLKARPQFIDADFRSLTLTFNRARLVHRFYLTAWVVLLDLGHATCVPAYRPTISQVLKSVKVSSTILISQRRSEGGQLGQARFFDRALRTVKE